MTYVVARYKYKDGSLMYLVLDPYEWEALAPISQISYEKLFETETEQEAEALVALLPERDTP